MGAVPAIAPLHNGLCFGKIGTANPFFANQVAASAGHSSKIIALSELMVVGFANHNSTVLMNAYWHSPTS